jgi:hypothetical protein
VNYFTNWELFIVLLAVAQEPDAKPDHAAQGQRRRLRERRVSNSLRTQKGSYRWLFSFALAPRHPFRINPQ